MNQSSKQTQKHTKLLSTADTKALDTVAVSGTELCTQITGLYTILQSLHQSTGTMETWILCACKQAVDPLSSSNLHTFIQLHSSITKRFVSLVIEKVCILEVPGHLPSLFNLTGINLKIILQAYCQSNQFLGKGEKFGKNSLKKDSCDNREDCLPFFLHPLFKFWGCISEYFHTLFLLQFQP